MKKIFTHIYYIPFLLSCNLVHSETILENPRFSIEKIEVNDLLVKNKKYNSDYTSTQCIQFFQKSSKKYMGDMCLSSNLNFLKDMGIENNINDSNPPEEKYTISTGTSQYPMNVSSNSSKKLFSALIDCDIKNGVIYRPTATCWATLYPLNKETYIYSNFYTKNEITKKTITPESTIIEIWKKLKVIDKTP